MTQVESGASPYNRNYAAIPTQLESVIACRSLNAVKLWLILDRHEASMSRDALHQASAMGRGAFNRALAGAEDAGLVTQVESLADESRLKLSRMTGRSGENPSLNGDNSRRGGEKATQVESKTTLRKPTQLESGPDLKIREDQDPKIHSFPSTGEKDEHDLVQDLIAFGVFNRIARPLVRAHGVEKVRAYLLAMPAWQDRYPIEKPGAYLVEAVRKQYPLDPPDPSRSGWDMRQVGVRTRSRWE